MRFSAAMCEVFHRNGYVRRKSWPEGRYLRRLGDSLAYENLEDLYVLNEQGFNATDWVTCEPRK